MALGTGFWCQTLSLVDEPWVKQDCANLSDTERRVWAGRIERICVIPSGEFGLSSDGFWFRVGLWVLGSRFWCQTLWSVEEI